MSDKLLIALRKKFLTPEQAVTALGLPASCLDVVDRYILAQDCQTVTHRATGRVIDKVSFMKTLFAKENPMIQRKLLARDQGATLPAKAGLQGQPRPNIDQDPDDPSTGPNTGAAPPTDEEIVSMLQLFLKGSNDPAGTIEAITNWVVSQGTGAGAGDQGVLKNNMSAVKANATDRRARDQRPRQAMDANVRAMNHGSFLKRFPDVAKNVDVWR